MYRNPTSMVAFFLLSLHGFHAVPLHALSDSKEVAAAERNPDANGNYHVGDGVSPPMVLYAPEPETTEESRQKHIGGTVFILAIVAEDGTTKDVHVVRSIGEDLSQQDKPLAGPLNGNAVKCVQRYRYKPARFKGKPVAVQISIQVSYKSAEEPQTLPK
jgi:Gram-negative bacterial TonB protein C-terminal